MGWASPTDYAKPMNVGLGRSRPNKSFFLLFRGQAEPSLAIQARLETGPAHPYNC
jgi:hypothetical protein